jgi:hypothetical protein
MEAARAVPTVGGTSTTRRGLPIAKDDPMSTTARLAPLSGLAGIVLFDVGWFWDPAAPFDSDSRIAAWYATHPDGPWLAAGALTILAAPFFLVFAGAVRDRLAAGGASPQIQRLVHGAGRGFGIAVLVFGAVYMAIPAARTFTSVGAPSADVSRFAGSAEFSVWMLLSTALMGTFAVGFAGGAFASRAVPRWLGVAVLVLLVPVLGNPVLPMAGITLLVVLVSITLTVRPLRSVEVGERVASRDPVAVG